VVTVGFSTAETSRFLERCSQRADLSLAMLSTALAVAHRQAADAPLWVDVERHGRDPVVPDLDVSRTVGWFVVMYPMRLDHVADQTPQQALERIAAQIDQVPAGGLGYGLLRYLSSDRSIRDSVQQIPAADVRLNYLGLLERVSRSHPQIRIAPEATGNDQSPSSRRTHLLEVDARIGGQRLQIDWTFSRHRHQRETIEELADRFIAVLRELTGGTDHAPG
jgi:microcystin synthetase protein McyA